MCLHTSISVCLSCIMYYRVCVHVHTHIKYYIHIVLISSFENYVHPYRVLPISHIFVHAILIDTHTCYGNSLKKEETWTQEYDTRLQMFIYVCVSMI